MDNGVLDKEALPNVLLEQLPVGVIVLDRDGRVVLFNRREEELARRKRSDVLGKDFFCDVAPCMNLRELGGTFRDKIGRSPLSIDLPVSFSFPFAEAPREVFVRMRSYRLNDVPYSVLYLEDVSAQKAVARAREVLTQLLMHDMKNPLAVVLTNLEFIRLDNRDQDLAQCIDDAGRASARLQRMVGNLLEITRLETTDLPINRQPNNASQLLGDVAREMKALAAVKDLEIVVDTGCDDLTASYDEDVLRRALDNLLDNAIRYAPRGSTVTLRGTRQSGGLHLQVLDEGPGIGADLVEVLFKPYQRALVPGTKRGMSQGLGLSFVRMAAEAHGGSALARAHQPRGTVFELIIP